MSQFKIGKEASDFSGETVQAVSNKFTSLSSGTTLFVKVLGETDRMSYFGYGMYQPQVYTFAAKNPSKKSAKGYPVEDLTSWDKAWKYHADKSEKFQDKHSKEAYKYSPKERGAFGFYDLSSGEHIVVDFTKKQAEAIKSAITKNATRLDRLAFELTKQGDSTNTTVSLTPVTFPEEDLTEKQRENFVKAPAEFDYSKFEGVVYEMDDEEMIEKLVFVGFDVSLIGLQAKAKSGDGEASENGADEGDVKSIPGEDDMQDEDLPF